MYRPFKIVQEPGPRARSRMPRKVAVVVATGEREALGDFAHDRYLARPSRADSFRFEWRSGSSSGPWKPDDGEVKRGREWRLVAVLRSGQGVHEASFQAWR